MATESVNLSKDDRPQEQLLEKAETQWLQGVELADRFITKQELSQLSACQVEQLEESEATSSPMELYALRRLAYNPEEGIIDKLANIYASMHSLNSSMLLIIRGNAQGQTEFYMGCRSTSNSDAASSMLKRSFEGNFPGSVLEEQRQETKNQILDCFFPLDYRRKSVVSLSVSADARRNRTEQRQAYIQGIEKFIDTMKSQEYVALFLAEPVSREDAAQRRCAYQDIITELSKYNKLTVSYNEGNSATVNESLTRGTSSSISNSITRSISKSTSRSVGRSRGSGTSWQAYSFFGDAIGLSDSKSRSVTKSKGKTKTKSEGVTESTGDTESTSQGKSETASHGSSLTLNLENRRISDLIRKMEYELKKMSASDSFGIWDAAVYLIAEDEDAALIGANSIRSLAVGDESGQAESFVNFWDRSLALYRDTTSRILKFLHYGIHPVFQSTLPARFSDSTFTPYLTPAVSVSGNALSTLMGLPMKSVPGVAVMETAEFGRNVVTNDFGTPGKRTLHLGRVVYMGAPENTPVDLYANSFTGHTFICGAPGSGKSNTVYNLLYSFARLSSVAARDVDENGVPYGGVKFLVIEPAKGEYKYELARMPGINLFTTKDNECAMLRINPFAFPYEHMNVMEHIERLKNIVTACWALTAAMPAILADALESVYLYAGWDLKNSIYVLPGKPRFPSFHDLLDVLPRIISASSYSADAKGDYTGALVTRVASLTKGIAGNVFTDVGTIDDAALFDENAIVDLSAVGSAEARSLIMGVLVMKLENYRRATAAAANYPLRHVTVLEEAHNLLPRCSTSQSDESSNVQGKSVELISAAIAEMRTYGEGFIIVDQSPHQVAEIAVSNTSTKIIMRLPGEEDAQSVGASVGLSEAQMRQIPMLAQGQAIVKQDNWVNPIMALIDRAPKLYASRNLPQYDYEALKEFRAEILGKCLQVERRCVGMVKVPDTDRDIVLNLVSRCNDIAPHHLDFFREKWLAFCALDKVSRHDAIPSFVMDVLSFHNGLRICRPRLRKIPEHLDNPEGDFLETLEDWMNRLEETLKFYVAYDSEEQISGLIFHICRYCVAFPPSKVHKLCALALVRMHVQGDK